MGYCPKQLWGIARNGYGLLSHVKQLFIAKKSRFQSIEFVASLGKLVETVGRNLGRGSSGRGASALAALLVLGINALNVGLVMHILFFPVA